MAFHFIKLLKELARKKENKYGGRKDVANVIFLTFIFRLSDGFVGKTLVNKRAQRT